ncbi:hypothetical protein [Streptomyces sp. PSKA30]|uniref:hypothetical protein n=1 Tax=Streptomyces sp. PSKA30 TaxID=2874597 RepID=UPI001CD18E8A|nr:hypothetical protein [Streptomyces sp. PSKA30]MBZ9642218.1 hypothetical protein [Streptomyces sp. PSKA30]
MHRTTTTATLLVTVAVSALAGCTTVQGPPVAGPPTAPSQPSPAGPDGRTEPQIVQAPAREALELIGPSRRSQPSVPAAPSRTAASTPPPVHQPPTPRPQPSRQSRPERSGPWQSPSPVIRLPDVSDTLRDTTDVCALGRNYGGWRPDSAEAVICERTYGR